MRTVDPDLWSTKLKKPPLNVSRSTKLGLQEISTLEFRLRESFGDAMVDFWRNASVEGVGFTISKKYSNFIRLLYKILLLVTTIFGFVVVVWNVQYFWNRPRLMVSLQSERHPLDRIDFPAVAICSNNIISRSALENYANHLYSLDRYYTYNITEIKRNLLAFGALHSKNYFTFDYNFVSHLANVARETNVTNILYKLSPKCDSTLVRCSWRSKRVRCQQLFAMRLTNIGFCCIFNSRFTFIDKMNTPKKTNLVGKDAGLSIIVRENSDDFMYVRRLGNGVVVLLFDGEQYPLINTGIVRVYAAGRNASVHLRLSATRQEAAFNLKYYTDDWLGCHAKRGVGSQDQTWSMCVGLCRAEAALALCKCKPHTLPPFDNSRDVCTLEHLPCLFKHKEKFNFLYPGDSVHESLSEEQEDSVECLHCYIGCERQRYRANMATIPYTNSFFLNRFFKGVDLTNTTIISIYYETENQRIFLVETGLRWFEALAIISSQFVIIVGVTVISVLELIYHCTFRWCHHYMRRWRRDRRMPKFRKTADTLD